MSSPGFRIVDGQAMYSAAWLEDAYELSDPKHPSYADRLAEAADLQRKARKENPPVGAETFKPPLACQARMPTVGNTWRFCKLPWNHKGGHVFD